jgi:RimJ/RimL family protein N-acetyltransferase
MIELRTPRRRLRPFTEGDTPAHLALYEDLEVTRQLGGGPFLGDQVAVRSRRAVEDLATGRFLGQCGLNTVDELGEIEVLYALERAAWGQGLATEAARTAVAYGFTEARLARIIAVTRPEHARSRRVLEKLGMRYERDVDVFGIHAVLYALGRDSFHAT